MIAKLWASLPKPALILVSKESDAQRAFFDAFTTQAKQVRINGAFVSGILEAQKGATVEYTFTRRMALFARAGDDEVYMHNFASSQKEKGAFSETFSHVAKMALEAPVTILTNLSMAKEPDVADAALRKVGFVLPPEHDMVELGVGVGASIDVLYSFPPPKHD